MSEPREPREPIFIIFVLGDGSTVPYKGEMGEVLRLPYPRALLDMLAAGNWMGVEVIRS
ncbi:MAG TPA: hypothetical protein VJX92_18910 [Methylomirabilota bacterium]|nr:hypothetical protein [Methylomirabilota bacterium]